MKAKVSKGKGFRGVLDYDLERGQVIGGTMVGKAPRELAAEFGLGRQLRPDIEKPVWHCSLSLPPGETLSAEKWEAIAADFMAEMGLQDNPYVVVKHDDTPHSHIHIIASRIGLDGGVWDDGWDVPRAIKATQELEGKYGLTRTAGLESVGNGEKRLTANELNQAARTGQEPTRQQLQKLVAEASADNPTATAFVERLATAGVQVKANIASTGRMNGFSFELNGIAFKASDLGKRFAWAELSKQVDYNPERDAEALRTMATTTKGEDHGRREETAIDLGRIDGAKKGNLRQVDGGLRGAGEENKLAGGEPREAGRERGGGYPIHVGRKNGQARVPILSRWNSPTRQRWQANPRAGIRDSGGESKRGEGGWRAMGVSRAVRDGVDAGTGARAGTGREKPRVHRCHLLTDWAGEAETEIFGSVQSLSSLSLAYKSGERDQGFLLDYASDPSPEPASIRGANDIPDRMQWAERGPRGVEGRAERAGGGISNGEIRGSASDGPDRASERDNPLGTGATRGNRDITASEEVTGAPRRLGEPDGALGPSDGPAIGGAQWREGTEQNRGGGTARNQQGLGEEAGGVRRENRGEPGEGLGHTGGKSEGAGGTTVEYSGGGVGRGGNRGAYERILGLAKMSEAARQKARIWAKQASGLEAEAYRLTLVGRMEGQKSFVVGKKGAEARLYNSDEVTNLIPLLSRKNAQGWDIYITPVSPQYHYLVIDDVKPEKLEQAKRNGIKPCVVLESSKANFQLILKIPKTSHPDEPQAINTIVRELNGEYGDPQFSGAVHPFRAGGFSNRKPGRSNEFVRVVEACGQIDGSTAGKLQRICGELEAKQQQAERSGRVESIADSREASRGGYLEAYRVAAKRARGYLQTDDWSRIDFHAAKIMLIDRWKGEAVAKAILEGSPDVATRKHDPEGYVERTVRAALDSKDVQEARAARARQSHHRGFSR